MSIVLQGEMVIGVYVCPPGTLLTINEIVNLAANDWPGVYPPSIVLTVDRQGRMILGPSSAVTAHLDRVV